MAKKTKKSGGNTANKARFRAKIEEAKAIRKREGISWKAALKKAWAKK